MNEPRQPWEPDQRKMGNWTAMFDTPRSGATPPPDQPAAPETAMFDDAELPHIDPTSYQPWILQRGQSRSAMMLALRWFDAKAGLWHGSAIAYPNLYAIDSIGERMVSLDFGTRHYVIEGNGLDELTRRLQHGDVAKIVEYTAAVWPDRPEGPVVRTIRSVAAQS